MTDEDFPAPTDDSDELDAADSVDSAEPEPDAHRERRTWLWLGAGGIVVLVVFMWLFWPVMQGRLDAVKQMDAAQVLLTQAEGSVGEVDKLVTVQLSPEAASAVPSVATQILVARRELDQAAKLVEDGAPHLTEDELKRADSLRAAIKARRIMIDRAPAILTASAKAVRAKSFGDRGWQLTKQASSAEVAAARLYELGTASNVESASVAIIRIKGQLGDARDLYSQAASAFPDAGFDRYIAYVGTRRAGVLLLDQAAHQWLSNDLPGAKATFALYEASVAKSSAAASALPYAPGTATGTAFRKVAGRAADAYAKAKKDAQAADKALSAP
jgi:hypothetical protein